TLATGGLPVGRDRSPTLMGQGVCQESPVLQGTGAKTVSPALIESGGLKPVLLASVLVFCAAWARGQDGLRAKVDRIYQAGGYERQIAGQGPPKPLPSDDYRPTGTGSGLPTEPVAGVFSFLPWVALVVIAVLIIASHVRARLRDRPSGPKAAADATDAAS